MSERVNKTYKPAELKAVIDLLQNNSRREFTGTQAHDIVIALYERGYRIVKVT